MTDSMDTPSTHNSAANAGIAVTITDTPSSITNSPLPQINNNRNTMIIDSQPKRKVSIAADPAVDRHFGHDNLVFEQNPKRKISQISQASVHSHSDIGPTRRKSILINAGHNNAAYYNDNESEHESTHSYDNGRPYRISALDSLNARINLHQEQTQFSGSNSLTESWIFSFCIKCRGEDNSPSWEPPHWQKLCPYPLCPSFRQFSRLLSIILIGIFIWTAAYLMIGPEAAPGGQLFDLVVLVVVANFGGYLISLTTLPRLIGMLVVGMLCSNMGWLNVEGVAAKATVHLRKFALTIILTRAGLEMEPEAFKKVYKTILKLGIIPWLIEGCIVAIGSHFALGLPWVWSSLLGSIIAAVSPAVVVPCLFRLRTKGYGVAKGIPTLIIAVAGIDDALSVALFGIISSLMFSERGIAYQISQAPVCIIGGLGFGVIWGNIARIFPEKRDPYVVPLRTLLLLCGGLVAIYGSEAIGYEGAGPLAVVFGAFVSNLFWCKQGWEIEDNPVATAFEIFWMIFEPILFGTTGATIKLKQLGGDVLTYGIGCIYGGAIIRIFVTAGIAFGDRLNMKEKFFVAISWMSKATVQAALGSVAMNHLAHSGDEEKQHYAYIIQTMAILSIVLTAPLGAILISITGPKLLTKTKQPQVLEGWRRSHRPSIRDISIIDEEEERDDPEIPKDKTTVDNTNTNTFIGNQSYTITK